MFLSLMKVYRPRALRAFLAVFEQRR